MTRASGTICCGVVSNKRTTSTYEMNWAHKNASEAIARAIGSEQDGDD